MLLHLPTFINLIKVNNNAQKVATTICLHCHAFRNRRIGGVDCLKVLTHACAVVVAQDL